MNTSEFFIRAWDWKPSVVIGCCGLIALYGWAVRFRFTWRVLFWLAGVALILLPLVSPLDPLADTYLFSIHMMKHILFVLAAPALLLLGLPAEPVESLLRHRWIAFAEHILSIPMAAWVTGIGAMAFWHIPALFVAASSSEPLHIIEHLSLLIAGTIFWWPIIAPVPRVRLRPIPQGAAYLFSACLACTGIGVTITFSRFPLYPVYVHPSDPYGILPLIRNGWGISREMDQQIGGLLMWVPCCLVYLTAIMAMFARWYGEETEDAKRQNDADVAAGAQWT